MSGSRLASHLKSPRVLAALAVAYAVLPSIVHERGDGGLQTRILAASGALLGTIPALVVARRIASRWRPAALLAGGVLGALGFTAMITLLMGVPYGVADAVSWVVSLPSLTYASSVTLLLMALRSAEPEHAAFPTAVALALTAFGLVPLANALSITMGAPWYPQVSLYWALGGGGVALLLLAAARWLPGIVDQVTHDVTETVLGIRPRVFLAATGLFVFAMCVLFAVICFGRQPHNADEVAQLWQARILLAGRLSLPADPNPGFFGMDNVIDRGRWYAQFPVGSSVFLAMGMALRAAWLVNPLLLALTVFPLYAFARHAYGEVVARASVLLFAFSPMALFMGASYMNHVPVLLLVCVALAQLAVWVDAEGRQELWRTAALIGLALGTMATIRPLDAALVAAAIGLLQLTRLRGSRARAESIAVQILAGAIPVGLLLWANARTTGAPLRFGYDVMYGSSHQPGFHVDPYGAMHSPIRALTYASKYLLQLDVKLLESPIPAVGVIVAGLLVLRRPSRWDVLLLGVVMLQLVAYALYWGEGEFRGPRFLFTALPAVLILMARAPVLVAAATRGTMRRTALLMLPVYTAAGWGTFNNDVSVMGPVRVYRSASPVGRVDPDSVARAAGLHHALVFVREGTFTAWQRRLWALGIPRSDVMRLLASAPACSIRRALITEENASAPDSARLGSILRTLGEYGQTIPDLPGCMAEAAVDGEGAATYAPFLPANTIDREGRIGGDVIYVLDLGPHNETLRARFGDRTWYTFGPRLDIGEAQPTLRPYAATPGVASLSVAPSATARPRAP